MKTQYRIFDFIKILICCSLLTIQGLASAQKAAVNDSTINADLFNMSLEELLNMEVVSASKKSEKASEAPATVHVISQQQILTRGYNYLDDLLMDIPEVEVQQQIEAETNGDMAIRGILGLNKFLILLDGHRITAPASSPHTIASNYSVANAERVEVIIGPASALYGVSAFSGIINIITKKSSSANGNLIASYGNYNTTDNAFFAGVGNDKVSFDLNGSLHYSNNPDMYNIYKDEFKWYNEEYSINGNMSDWGGPINTLKSGEAPKLWDKSTEGYTLNGTLRYKSSYIGFFTNAEEHSLATGVNPAKSIYSSDARIKNTLYTIYGGHDHKMANDKLTLSTQLQYSKAEIDPKTKYLNIYTHFEDGYKYSMEESFFFNEQASYTINENSDIIGGVQYQYINSIPKTSDLPRPYDTSLSADNQAIEYIGTDITNNEGTDLTIYQDIFQVKYHNIGAFAQYRLSILNDVIRITAGLRYDHNTRYGDTVNPRIGVVAMPTNRLTIKALFGTAFLEPSPYTAYQHYGSFRMNNEGTGLTSGFWHLPNPDLKPERLNTIETSISYKLSDKWNISMNSYINEMSNLIESAPSTAENWTFHDVGIGYIETPQNIGTANIYGGTLRVNTSQRFGENVKLYGSIAHSYTGGTVDGKPLNKIANNFIKSNIDLYVGKFSLGLSGIYRFARDFEIEEDDNVTRIESSESYTLINANIRYQALSNDKLNLSLFTKVNNVLNQKYYALYRNSSTEFAHSPQEPIRFRVGVQCTFK